ncbi:MAG: V-type ATP synthase subunit A [Candidatus Odinarchaeia archaeon]
MVREGKIIRITGPLVTAEGMRGTKMYEVCRVGDEQLIGEVNRVQGDLCFIQVYEETAGIKPGEKVIATGKPLSVELGPGLIGQMFDGIQRPLPKIREVAGDFITRGITVNALPRDKKWKFTPQVKKGDVVNGGDILGVVPETTLVEHKIMVPPNVSGEVIEIVEEGEYTLEDIICKVKSGKQTYELKMFHEWPVRKPRPIKEKIPTEVPLITGQRIIDTFFPVAKGGTSAIPGGFGTGKCVLPDTPVLLGDGTITSIENLFKKVKGREADLTLKEELIKVNSNIVIYTFDGSEITPTKISHVYRGYSDRIVEIETASGRKIRVTPAHKLIKFNPNGFFEEQPAEKLTEGEYLVIPRKIPITQSYQELTNYPTYIKELRSRDYYANKEAIRILKETAKKVGGYKKLATLLQIKKSTLDQYITGRNKMPLTLMKQIYKLAGREFIPPQVVGIPRSAKQVKIPEVLDEKFSEILGLLFSDGMITRREIRFFNNEEIVLNRFTKLFTEVFGVKPQPTYFKTVKGVKVNSSVIVKILKAIGMPQKKKSKNAHIPQIILRSPDTVITAFIRGYYIGDGSFSKGIVEINTASRQMLRDLSYLLTRLGILYSVFDNDHSYRLIISSISELEKLIKVIDAEEYYQLPKIRKIKQYVKNTQPGRVTRDLIPLSPEIIKEFLKIYSKRTFERNAIPIGSYIYGKSNLSTKMLTKILGVISTENQLILRLNSILNALEFVALDKIEKITIKTGKYIVYDITVPETHNFIGGDVPTILHNTVTLHQLASWCDSKIIVYVGCGERGNEMTEVLEKFPTYKDPWTGEPLMNRTILIANTSNMPVAAREASIYTGITIAEYFRDMGYDIALQADSTSRWAEALREISGRLEEMPGEEGYPAYLATKLAEFYERAGRVRTLNGAIGSITVTGAVSPPGGDFSEPVTQATLRIIKTFWALDTDLAHRRHFPAINWLNSYSLYLENLQEWYNKNIDVSWNKLREEAMAILEKEEELKEIVQLVGPDALPESERVILEAARMIREDYLQQSAIHPIDTFCPLDKMYLMLRIIMKFYHNMRKMIDKGVSIKSIIQLPIVDKIARMKIIPYDNKDKMRQEFAEIEREMDKQFEEILPKQA